MMDTKRCPWCGNSPIYVAYHDEIWGVPEFDSKTLFAKLILDGAQAGLSWITILKRQNHYYRLFDGLDPHKIARYDDERLEQILLDKGIIRNRLKVYATRTNAIAYCTMEDKGIDFSAFLWSFVGGAPIVNRFEHMDQVPVTTAKSDAMSQTLKKAGFKFVGSTICYAFMQAVGMFNDHLISCHRWKDLQ